MKKRTSSILWGIILIALGVILALNALGITHFEIFFDGWWTLFIIVPCLIGLFTDSDKIGSLIGICIGVFLLLCCQDILEFEMLWKLLFPAIIIIIGIKLIFGDLLNKERNEVMTKVKENGTGLKECAAVFSGSNINFDGETFCGAELNAVFGGVKCDLRNAIINGDAVINASSIFGGIDIYVPENVNIKIASHSVFGGVSNHQKNRDGNTVTLYINATCMFGGVSIK